jgi:histidinol-phosphate/aromatic aminotransferase/cobyric acid decarboxylase-like protein
MLNHGGRIHAYAKQYGIGLKDWLDLSTGINPNGWPVPEQISTELWTRLPENEDDLIDQASCRIAGCYTNLTDLKSSLSRRYPFASLRGTSPLLAASRS